MLDILTQANTLKRPSLLVRAARHGIEDYNRTVHLRGLLKSDVLPGQGQAIMKLMELEAVINAHRIAKRAEYTVAHHVEILVALMCEANTLKSANALRKRALEITH